MGAQQRDFGDGSGGRKTLRAPLGKAVVSCAKGRGLEVPDPEGSRSRLGGSNGAVEGAGHRGRKEDFVQGNGVTLSAAAQKSVSAQTEQGRTAVLVARGNEAVD